MERSGASPTSTTRSWARSRRSRSSRAAAPGRACSRTAGSMRCRSRRPDRPADGDAAAMQREIAELSTWHELTKSRRGRTTFGVSGLTPSAAARWLSDFMADPKVAIYRDGLERVPALRLVAHDLRTYHLE